MNDFIEGRVVRTSVNDFRYEIDGESIELTRSGDAFTTDAQPVGWADLERLNIGAGQTFIGDFTHGVHADVRRVSDTEHAIRVPLPPAPTITGLPSNITVLQGKSVKVNVTVSVYGPSPKYSYDGSRSVTFNSSGLTIYGSRTGTDTVRLTVTDKWGRSATASITVLTPNKPTLSNISNQTIDSGKSKDVRITPNSHNGKFTVSVKSSHSRVSASYISSSKNVRIKGNSEGSATITVTVTDQWGQTISKSFKVTVKRVVSWMHPLGDGWPRNSWTTYYTEPSHAAGAVDFGAGYGGTPPLYAPCNGKVIYAGPWGWYNALTVVIQPNGEGVGIAYLHMSSINVKVGDTVSTGQHVGNVGWTGFTVPAGPGGAHLHLEVRMYGNQWGPWYSSVQYFKDRGVTL